MKMWRQVNTLDNGTTYACGLSSEILNDRPKAPAVSVAYWMQQLQRAIRGSIPVIVVVERVVERVGELGHVSENLSKCVGHLWEEGTARNSKM